MIKRKLIKGIFLGKQIARFIAKIIYLLSIAKSGHGCDETWGVRFFYQTANFGQIQYGCMYVTQNARRYGCVIRYDKGSMTNDVCCMWDHKFETVSLMCPYKRPALPFFLTYDVIC